MHRMLSSAVLATCSFIGPVLMAGDQDRRAPSLLVYDDGSNRNAARNMLGKYVEARLEVARLHRESQLASLRSADDWRNRQRQTRDRLQQILGDFGPRCPLNARVVGRLDRPDYTIEKLIFESQPNYHCTANVYLPQRRQGPLPGVLFTCGHSPQGKSARLYHECCLGLVLKGYVVLALDPTGQGERSEYFHSQTGEPAVPLCVSQHHYLARPSWLVGRSLAGYRTWDCRRALDYLLTRPEVDGTKIAAVGNSGGGIMALLITATDPRVKVCAAAHPGGSMEATYLTGRELPRADILGLIAPRPCLFVVGNESGEEASHRRKMVDMLQYYDGLGVSRERCQLVLVHGLHDMKQPKREPCYGWLNRWFDQEQAGAEEPQLAPEVPQALHCTMTGSVIRDLGGESGQTLNAKLAEKLSPPRAAPPTRSELKAQQQQLRNAVARRLGLKLVEERRPPACTTRGVIEFDGFSAEKLLVHSEDQIALPALLLQPTRSRPEGPIIVLMAEAGKPIDTEPSSLAIQLVRAGLTVFAVDVRGTGETDPRDRSQLRPVTHYDAQQFRFDTFAVRAAQFGTTMLAMRSYDVIRTIDYVLGRPDLSSRPVVLIGQGLGGTWALAAATFDRRPAAVVCVGTLASYRLLVDSRWYAVRDYFWVNGALHDFDLPDLVGLVAPRPVTLIDSVDPILEPIGIEQLRQEFQWADSVYRSLGWAGRLRYRRSDTLMPDSTAQNVLEAVRAMGIADEQQKQPQ